MLMLWHDRCPEHGLQMENERLAKSIEDTERELNQWLQHNESLLQTLQKLQLENAMHE